MHLFCVDLHDDFSHGTLYYQAFLLAMYTAFMLIELYNQFNGRNSITGSFNDPI